ncbi:MAG TPA: TraR/DksA C4-type zinc finger protein [Steroidobacteraceae bacterium]|nr:TraR/DksA C4-type zinc finger protein [Steroidobacteraceae bacterium]
MNITGDETLRKAREQLLARGAELRERVQRIDADLRRKSTPLPRDAPDAAIIIENDEILQAIDETAHRELRQIKHALERIEAGTFAVCETCGATIEAGRRRVVPYTTHCRDCAKDA